MRTYSLYLSTLSSINAPTNKTNLAQVKWSVNWREIFGNKVGNCRVRTHIISKSSNVLTWANNVGSCRINLASNTSNCSSGLNLGMVRPMNDFSSATVNTTYLECDTTMSSGLSMSIPSFNTEVIINFFGSNDMTPMLNVQEYQVWLYFDVDSEDPYVLSN